MFSLSFTSIAVERVLALYSYAAQNDDELTFQKDAVIGVINKDNPDWWFGEVEGESQTGVFPSNYVTPYTKDSEASISCKY